MATAKKSPAKGASNSKALVKWDETFAKHATQAKAQEKGVGGGQFVSFGRGKITVDGGELPGGKMECIILGSCHANEFYGKDYDPDDIQPPICYAFGVDDEDMAPHKEASDPQSSNCAECDHNQFGTAKRGRGKACANRRRIALILANDAEDGDETKKATMYMARVSPTNLKAWAGYVRDVADKHKRPTWAVVTEISSFDDPDQQIRLEFKLVDTISDNDILYVLHERSENIQDALQIAYPPPVDRKAARRSGGGSAGGSRKFAQGKAPARSTAKR